MVRVPEKRESELAREWGQGTRAGHPVARSGDHERGSRFLPEIRCASASGTPSIPWLGFLLEEHTSHGPVQVRVWRCLQREREILREKTWDFVGKKGNR
jgi:hypothetical protein